MDGLLTSLVGGLLGGGTAAVALGWLLQSIIAERLKHEYASELAKTRQELETASQYDLQILVPRLQAYCRLWASTGRLATWPKDQPLAEGLHTLEAELRAWYYKDGHGIYLSFQAAELFLQVLDAIKTATDQEKEAVLQRLSSLRTQLKSDIRVYDPVQAATELAIGT
jgi:hypothetical protein